MANNEGYLACCFKLPLLKSHQLYPLASIAEMLFRNKLLCNVSRRLKLWKFSISACTYSLSLPVVP